MGLFGNKAYDMPAGQPVAWNQTDVKHWIKHIGMAKHKAAFRVLSGQVRADAAADHPVAPQTFSLATFGRPVIQPIILHASFRGYSRAMGRVQNGIPGTGVCLYYVWSTCDSNPTHYTTLQSTINYTISNPKINLKMRRCGRSNRHPVKDPIVDHGPTRVFHF